MLFQRQLLLAISLVHIGHVTMGVTMETKYNGQINLFAKL